MSEACCYDCKRQYGERHGFSDLIIPLYIWEQISPFGNEVGLLCPCCICKRLYDKGISCEGAFLSGPIRSVSSVTMGLLRQVENLQRDQMK